jgi:hypothetical protein
MTRDIRTPRGKLIGKFNENTGVLCIINGNKETKIVIPPDGLRLCHSPGDGITEEVYILLQEDKQPRTA